MGCGCKKKNQVKPTNTKPVEQTPSTPKTNN